MLQLCESRKEGNLNFLFKERGRTRKNDGWNNQRVTGYSKYSTGLLESSVYSLLCLTWSNYREISTLMAYAFLFVLDWKIDLGCAKLFSFLRDILHFKENFSNCLTSFQEITAILSIQPVCQSKPQPQNELQLNCLTPKILTGQPSRGMFSSLLSRGKEKKFLSQATCNHTDSLLSFQLPVYSELNVINTTLC